MSNFHRGRASPDKEKASSNWSLRTGKIVTGVSDKEWEAMGSIATLEQRKDRRREREKRGRKTLTHPRPQAKLDERKRMDCGIFPLNTFAHGFREIYPHSHTCFQNSNR